MNRLHFKIYKYKTIISNYNNISAMAKNFVWMTEEEKKWCTIIRSIYFEWVCTCVQAHINTPSAAADISWFSEQVWWAGHLTAVCDPAVVSVPTLRKARRTVIDLSLIHQIVNMAT